MEEQVVEGEKQIMLSYCPQCGDRFEKKTIGEGESHSCKVPVTSD